MKIEHVRVKYSKEITTPDGTSGWVLNFGNGWIPPAPEVFYERKDLSLGLIMKMIRITALWENLELDDDFALESDIQIGEKDCTMVAHISDEKEEKVPEEFKTKRKSFTPLPLLEEQTSDEVLEEDKDVERLI